MSQLSKASSAIVAAALMTMISGHLLAAGSQQTIKIKTMSKQGFPVSAKIMMKRGDAEWVVVLGSPTPDGGVSLTVDPCDSTVQFAAADLDNQETYARENPGGTLSCETPEIVFSDYVLVLTAWVDNSDRISQTATWINALGGDEAAREKGAEIAFKLQEALRSGDAGYVAIGSAELAATLRKAGKYEDARFFQNVSLQAAMAGIADKVGAATGKTKFLVTEPNQNYMLSPSGAELLKQYQTEDLGLPAASIEAGKIGWHTMNSLLTGPRDAVAVFTLSPTEIDKLDTKTFLDAG